MNEQKPVLVIGLGNPGAKYTKTRHNVGFFAVDLLAGVDAKWKSAHQSLVYKAGNKIFAKPQTFMNLSGRAVQSLMAFYKVPIENIIVIHDEIDLPTGAIREKIGGGAAGHNGIKSIDTAIGNNYRRIRIGVGRPQAAGTDSGILGFLFPPRMQSVADYVLSRFTDAEIHEIEKVISEIEI